MPSHQYPVATLTLSGETHEIGNFVSDSESTITLKTLDDSEESFMTVAEAKLMVAALETAIDRIEDGTI